MWTAVVLTGGRSSRFGRDKAGTTVDGITMLDRVLLAIPPAVPVVVVGPDPGPTRRSVLVCREEPAGGGPAAGVAAALDHVGTEDVVVLATDMPMLGELPQLLATALRLAPGDVDGVCALDGGDRLQPLCAAYRVEALAAAAADVEPVTDKSMRQLVANLMLTSLSAPASGGTADDVDTVERLLAVERMLASGRTVAASAT